MKKIN